MGKKGRREGRGVGERKDSKKERKKKERQIKKQVSKSSSNEQQSEYKKTDPSGEGSEGCCCSGCGGHRQKMRPVKHVSVQVWPDATWVGGAPRRLLPLSHIVPTVGRDDVPPCEQGAPLLCTISALLLGIWHDVGLLKLLSLRHG